MLFRSVLPALEHGFGAVLRLHGLQLGIGVCALADALYERPEGVTLSAVSPAYAGHAAIAAFFHKIRVFCHYITFRPA